MIFKLPIFAKNLRNEIKTNHKIYFYDTGVRNVVIGDFMAMELRQYNGHLWESFLIAERLKLRAYFDGQSLFRVYHLSTGNRLWGRGDGENFSF